MRIIILMQSIEEEKTLIKSRQVMKFDEAIFFQFSKAHFNYFMTKHNAA